jgi:GT2 family glycosyltransferase
VIWLFTRRLDLEILMPAGIRQFVRKHGFTELMRRAYHRVLHGGYQHSIYRKWREENEAWDAPEIKRQIEAFPLAPKVSIVTPVYNADMVLLDRCIESVKRQLYDNWELCLYDDASTRQEALEYLHGRDGEQDPRVKVSFGEVNQHISLSLNEAVRMAGGEYVAILDQDDELSPAALYETVRLINEHPDADLIYSDEDKIDARGRRTSPFFKPDWSPDLLMSVNYINHFCVIRKAAGDRVGWFRAGFEGAQDHDLFLRISRESDSIFHIPRILYHWRAVPGSTAMDVGEKDYSSAAGVRALQEHLEARGERAAVSAGEMATEYVVRREVAGTPKVSIIIPFKDKVELLKTCLDSILGKSSYKNYEIILVSNNSEEQATIEYLDSLSHPGVKVIRHDEPFNYSKINNRAAREATGEFLLFLNNDTEVITTSWIEDMLGYAQQPEKGAVGVKLLFDDDTIQHGGVIVGIGGFADHAFAGAMENNSTFFGRDTWSRNYLAVTAACMMVEKEKFDVVGGFDEEFVVCGSDVELCLRLHQAGYRSLYLGFVKLYHHEAQTRKQWVHEKDIECSLKHYALYLENGDPYYNKNLSLERADGNSLRQPA